MDNKENPSEQIPKKQDADGAGDSSREILQHEKLIDPGNEHTHDAEKEFREESSSRSKPDADPQGDGPGK